METLLDLSRLSKFQLILVCMLASILGTSCTSKEDDLRQELTNSLKKNPEILTQIIEENPLEFSEAIQSAFNSSREQMARERREQEEKDFYQSFEEPLKPKIRSDDVIRGNPEAELTLIEYVDFECPFCARGFETVEELESRYDGEIRVVLKHFPLSFHPKAMPAARYYEALRLQNGKFAVAFYHQVFKNQARLENGDIFLREIAAKVGANMQMLKDDLASNVKINERIKEDMEEAKGFGFRGTPGFVLSGIPIRGAYPIEYFERVIHELEKRKMVNVAGSLNQ